MRQATGTPVPHMTNETSTIEWARDGWAEEMAEATTPPEADATTEDTMGSRKVGAMLEAV